eukprot:315642-Pyramimonas_sp.AAC.1
MAVVMIIDEGLIDRTVSTDPLEHSITRAVAHTNSIDLDNHMHRLQCVKPRLLLSPNEEPHRTPMRT